MYQMRLEHFSFLLYLASIQDNYFSHLITLYFHFNVLDSLSLQLEIGNAYCLQKNIYQAKCP